MRARCYPLNMPKRRFHNINPQVHHNLLCHRYPIDIPYISWYTSLLSMVIPDICSICRILCSQCPHIPLSWTTQRTSLLRNVGLPGPSFISPATVYEVNQWHGTLGGASLVWGVSQCLRLRCSEWLWGQKGLDLVMPPGPKGGTVLQRWRRPSEARNESGLARKEIHGITMVVPNYDKIS